jgi:flagellar hook-associated protein 2
MATLRLPGLQTGIDTSSLIEQLMVIERRTLNTWQQRIELWEQKQEALSTLETKLQNLRSSIRALSDSDELKAFNVSTSDDDYLTAEATNEAFEGSHNIVINQLANAERWVHTAGHEYKEDYVGAGTFIYSYNYKETSITTTATTTLHDLVGLINNDANNPGVTAGLLYYNDAYHLVLNGNDAGTDYEIKINSGTTEVKESSSAFTKDNDNALLTTKIIDLDRFDGSLGDDSPYITIDGTDHFGVDIDDVNLYVTDQTTLGHLISEINDAFDGRAKAVLENGKILLTDSEDGVGSLSISLTYTDPDESSSLTNLTLSQKTQGLDSQASLENYELQYFTLSQAAQDSKIKVDGFPNTSAASEIQTATLSDSPNGGTFTLTYRGETTSSIGYNATAGQIKTALEALSTVNSGDITVSGSIANGTTFTFASSLGNVDLIMIKSSLTKSGNPITASIAETTPGSDGYISRSSNTVDDVISGVTLHLHDTTDDNGQDITLTRDIQSVKDKINKMVMAYNFAIEHIKETTGYNEVTEVAGILMGDYVVSTIRYQFREPLIEQAAGFLEDVDTYLTPLNIGLELDENGILSFDENDFDKAIGKDYEGVLELIGARNIGSSTDDDIEFYSATDYTTAGTYNVRVTVAGGAIAGNGVEIKLSNESTYRYMSYSSGIATGISTLNDDNGYPDYAECQLQLSIDEAGLVAQGDGTYTATVYVKQGFTGKIEDAIDRMLKAKVGSISVDKEHMESQVELLEDKIEDEEYRLEQREQRLINRFARLEQTLALIQGQLAAAGIIVPQS